MREKSIREKLGKAFSKWIVITLLAGILVPMAPREVKASEATVEYNPGTGVIVKENRLDVSKNYILKITNGSSDVELLESGLRAIRSDVIIEWQANAINENGRISITGQLYGDRAHIINTISIM